MRSFSHATVRGEREREREIERAGEKIFNGKYLYKYAIFTSCIHIQWKRRKCYGTIEVNERKKSARSHFTRKFLEINFFALLYCKVISCTRHRTGLLSVYVWCRCRGLRRNKTWSFSLLLIFFSLAHDCFHFSSSSSLSTASSSSSRLLSKSAKRRKYQFPSTFQCTIVQVLRLFPHRTPQHIPRQGGVTAGMFLYNKFSTRWVSCPLFNWKATSTQHDTTQKHWKTSWLFFKYFSNAWRCSLETYTVRHRKVKKSRKCFLRFHFSSENVFVCQEKKWRRKWK